ncbi:hypothetical protein GW17_00038384 [Ensete ventricosum]|nr:hypothetical protein GW17_00038384 [Ensete ventricosum]
MVTRRSIPFLSGPTTEVATASPASLGANPIQACPLFARLIQKSQGDIPDLDLLRLPALVSPVLSDPFFPGSTTPALRSLRTPRVPLSHPVESMEADGAAASFPLAKWRSDFSRAFQHYLDKSTPHATGRWLGTVGVAAIYFLRVYFLQGFYIITYGLGIYLLNLLIGFLSPLVDPEIEVSDGPALPTKGSDEFKPFVRRLPEFKF